MKLLSKKCKILLSVVSLAVLAGCDVMGFDKNAAQLVPGQGQKPNQKTIDDRVDEEKPPFVDVPPRFDGTAGSPTLPGGNNGTGTPLNPSNPGNTNTNTSVGTSPGTGQPTNPGTGGSTGTGFGVFGNLSCQDYVSQFWKVGAFTHEEAPGPLFTKLVFESKVLYVSGTTVTLSTKIETGSAQNNVNEQLVFDACKDGHKSAIPSNAPSCGMTDLGTETITVQGKSYKTRKIKLGMCTTTKGETYQSIVWRAQELPLWGVIKREVTGTVVPAILNGKISPITSVWNF